MFIYVSVTCNFQQHIRYTSCLTFSTNHHWFQGVDWSHLEPPRWHRFPPFTPFQPSLSSEETVVFLLQSVLVCFRFISSQALRDISPTHIQPYSEPSHDRSSCFPSPTKKGYFTWLLLIMKASSLRYPPTTSSTSYTFQLYQSNSQACHSPLWKRSLVH